MRRTFFQRYLYGQLLLPQGLFEKMLSLLPPEKQEHFASKTFTKARNWGAAKGGRALLEKYPEEFKKRREKGLKKLQEFRTSNYLRTGVANFRVDPSIPLSKELCEFVGAFIGDGYITMDKTVGICGCASFDKEYLCFLSLIANSLFGINGKLSLKKDCDGIEIRFNSKELCRFFKQKFGFGSGSKTHSVQIPEK